MRSVLCGAVVLCLLQCYTALPVEEFVGYPFSNETHQVYLSPNVYHFPVNISLPFIIDGRELTGLLVSHFLAVIFLCQVMQVLNLLIEQLLQLYSTVLFHTELTVIGPGVLHIYGSCNCIPMYAICCTIIFVQNLLVQDVLMSVHSL